MIERKTLYRKVDPAPNFEFVHVRKVKLLAGDWLERI